MVWMMIRIKHLIESSSKQILLMNIHWVDRQSSGVATDSNLNFNPMPFVEIYGIFIATRDPRLTSRLSGRLSGQLESYWLLPMMIAIASYWWVLIKSWYESIWDIINPSHLIFTDSESSDWYIDRIWIRSAVTALGWFPMGLPMPYSWSDFELNHSLLKTLQRLFSSFD